MGQTSLEFDELAETENPSVSPDSLGEDDIIDYISNRVVKLRGNEEVRQRIARALFHEYGIAVEDMERDFKIPVQIQGARKVSKKADIAIFKPGSVHSLENLQRVVICKPLPKPSKTVTKIRTHEQAKQDIQDLEVLLGTEANAPNLEYGMWTNGLDFFFLRKETGRFGATFEPRADWPVAPESLGSRSVGSAARLRRGEHAMLKTAFQRCHNYVHGNEGMSKETAFWQFLYLMFAKIHDERTSQRTGRPRKFYAMPNEPFTADGRKAIAQRIKELFTEVKGYAHFDNRDEITLSPAALAFIVGELSSYDLTSTDLDVKGLAYQELVGKNLRGDRGQYFTPSGAVDLMVEILNPQEHQRVLDPACGTGGFLRGTMRHLLHQWKVEDGTLGLPDTPEQIARLAKFARTNLFGADFDQSLVRATVMSIMMLTDESAGDFFDNVFFMDSLMFPDGDKPGNHKALERIEPNSIDVLMTNPPFGTEIKVEEAKTLDRYRDGVAQSWTRDRETGALVPGRGPVTAMAPEQLFIEQAVKWVCPGGKIGIVLPNGILSNPGPADEATRRWILDNCWVLASIELPVETFIVEADVNIQTSLLFLKKKTDQERMNSTLGGPANDYPVFMAIAERIGKDRRGNDIYKRGPDGKDILVVHEEFDRVRINGEDKIRRLVRKIKEPDNDLPVIARKYREFRDKYPEPGMATR